MPQTQNLELGSIDIGSGVFATRVWLSDGPIVLIATRSKTGEVKNSRFDLQKAMFIDPLPGERMESGVRAVVKAVRAENHR